MPGARCIAADRNPAERPMIMNHHVALAVAACAAGPALALSGMGAAQAAFPGHNGKIVYVETVFPSGILDDGRNEVFLVQPDGTGRRQLTYKGENDNPAWAPRGHRILYRHSGRHADALMVMDAHGHHKHRLVGGFTEGAAWAPGGGRIVFARYSSARHVQDLYIYAFATGRISRLHVDGGGNRIPAGPAWSPDGKTIAFSATGKGSTDPADPSAFPPVDLFTVHPDGTSLTQITATPQALEERPNWSPDSQRLVYQVFDLSGFCEEYLAVSGADGTNPRRVRAGCRASAPAWSPNGRRLVADLGKVRRAGVWTLAVDGSRQRYVTNGVSADWQPLTTAPGSGAP
jgi:Tol biopolymer transport system component